MRGGRKSISEQMQKHDAAAQPKQLFAKIEKNLTGIPESAQLHASGMGPFLPSSPDGAYEVWIGVNGPWRFENYAVTSVAPSGTISVQCGQCEPPKGPVSATRSAVDDFKRLC